MSDYYLNSFTKILPDISKNRLEIKTIIPESKQTSTKSPERTLGRTHNKQSNTNFTESSQEKEQIYLQTLLSQLNQQQRTLHLGLAIKQQNTQLPSRTMRNILYSIFSDVQVSRQLMFDVTEIPHCLKDLSSTFFALDMKRLKTAHQYMKGTIPEKMYQKIKSKLQKHLAVLLKSHRQLLRIELDQIEDESTFQLYNFTKRYFSSCKVESSFQLGSLAPHSSDSNEILSTDMLSDEMDC